MARTSSPKEWASARPCPQPTCPSTSTTPRSLTLGPTYALSSSLEVLSFWVTYTLMSKVMDHSVRGISKVRFNQSGLRQSLHIFFGFGNSDQVNAEHNLKDFRSNQSV